MWDIVNGDSRVLIKEWSRKKNLPRRENTVIITDPPWPDNRLGERMAGGDPYALFRETSRHFHKLASRVIVIIGCKSNPAILSEIKLPFMRASVCRYVCPSYYGSILMSHLQVFAYSEKHYRTIKDTRVIPGIFDLISRRNNEPDHPTPLPPAFLCWLIKWYTRPDALVIDPFAGSGEIVKVAAMMGRDAIGVEKNRRYYREATARVKGRFGPLFPGDEDRKKVLDILGLV